MWRQVVARQTCAPSTQPLQRSVPQSQRNLYRHHHILPSSSCILQQLSSPLSHQHPHLHLYRRFSSDSPRRRNQLHPRQESMHKVHADRLARAQTVEEALAAVDEIPTDEQIELAERNKNPTPSHEPPPAITRHLDIDSLVPKSKYPPGPPTTIATIEDASASASTSKRIRDEQGRAIIRTKLHPEGALVGRGRVVSNFGTRIMVQELPWKDPDEEEGEVGDVELAAKFDEKDPSPPARFIAQPRGKLGKVVCGDIVLWEWSVYGGAGARDFEAFIVEVLPRRTEMVRLDARAKGGREQVLLAANFDHLAIVCAPRPATSFNLIDRYLAAAQSMGVTSSIVFNKIDLEDVSKKFMPALDDYVRIGVPVFKTSTTKGKERGMEELRRHLASVGPGGKSGVTIFVGQSGSGKSSILNALSPSLKLAVNSLSRNHQGRHTTTQTILHALESGGEIIDSPGFQNYRPLPEELAELDQGFTEFREPAKLCHYGHRCLHMGEPACAVRLALQSTNDGQTIDEESLDAIAAEQEARGMTEPSDEREARRLHQADETRRMDQLLHDTPETRPVDLLPDPEDVYAEQESTPIGVSRAHLKWKESEWNALNRTKMDMNCEEIALENAHLRRLAVEEKGKEKENTSASSTVAPAPDALPLSDADPDQFRPQRDPPTSMVTRSIEIIKQLESRGLLESISQRRYKSYVALVEQQKEILKKQYE